MELEKKKQIVEGLREKFSKSKVVIITDYKGLDVKKMSALRRKLGDGGIECRVVKNTLLVRASEGTDVAAVKDAFMDRMLLCWAMMTRFLRQSC